MNDFDDLFEKPSKEKETKGQNQIDDLYKYISNSKVNLYMLLIYIFSSFLFSLGVVIITNATFPNSEDIQDNIVMVSEPTVSVNYNDNLEPESAYLYGVFLNNSDYDFPYFWLNIELFGTDNVSLGKFSFDKDSLLSNQSYILDETVAISAEPISYEVSYGFDFSSLFYVVFSLLQAAIAAILFLIIDWQSFKENWLTFKGNLRQYLGQTVIGFFLLMGALIAAQLILQSLDVTGTSENEMQIQKLFAADPTQLVLLFLLLCVFTPIVEEVIFRKVLFGYVESRTSSVFAIIMSGAIFGIMHVLSYGDFIQSIPYIFLGLMLGYIYYRAKKNILVSIGAHSLNNLYVFVIYVLTLYGIL